MTSAAHDARSVAARGPVVVLTRHGRTALNAAGELRGHLDPELDDVGQRGAEVLADSVAVLLRPREPVRIVTSPLRRAVQTAQAVAAASRAPVQVSHGLIDRDYGPWAGHNQDEVVARFGSLDAADGVEPAEAVVRRARKVLDAQLPVLSTGPVVLVAHDAVNRLLLAALDPALGPPERIGQRTACWNLLVYREGGWQVSCVDHKDSSA